MNKKKCFNFIFVYILLIVLLIMWFFFIVWVVFISFCGEGSVFVNYFIFKIWILDNYVKFFI